MYLSFENLRPIQINPFNVGSDFISSRDAGRRFEAVTHPVELNSNAKSINKIEDRMCAPRLETKAIIA